MDFKWIVVPLFIFAMPITYANNASIKIEGRVLPAPCTVNGDTVKKTISFNQTEARSLSEAGTGGEWNKFSLELDDCPAYLNYAIATFSGTPDEDDPNMYKNNGDASNVALQLADDTTTYGDGSSMTISIDPVTHKGIFMLSARMYTPKGNVGKGTFNSVVGVNFTYQ